MFQGRATWREMDNGRALQRWAGDYAVLFRRLYR